ncbi:MAG: amidohydrolase family protein [Hadesarchaea archaeon]|nr:amidohydrolase family protein [Hadesarchaea archaeon]
MRKIDFEAHFYTKEFVKTLLTCKEYPRYEEDKQTDTRRLWYTPDVWEPHGDILLNKLLDVGEGRLKEMDAAGVDIQVLSLSAPGVEQFDVPIGTALARETNDALSNIVEKHPDKFIGFAALAPKNPSEAADELERTIRDLGLKGWKTHSNISGTYLDNNEYWPIFEKAEKLDVPIFLHPTIPTITELRTYGYALAGPTFGFGFDTAICMMRLIFSGVFDKYPKLKFILGHLGEALPFNLSRIDFMWERPWCTDIRPKLMKKPSDYFKNNVFVNTSGNFHQPAVMCTYQALGGDKMLFGTDYPYEEMTKAVQCIETSSIPEKDKDKIFYLNAQKLFRI